jgi:hypothetical protein
LQNEDDANLLEGTPYIDGMIAKNNINIDKQSKA